MSDALTDYAENALLDHLLGTASMTSPSCYLALYTVAPTDSTTGTEVSGTGYARQLTAFDAASGGTAVNTNTETFGPAGSDWGTVVACAVLDASTGGNMLFYATLGTSRTVLTGDTVNVDPGDLSLTLG